MTEIQLKKILKDFNTMQKTIQIQEHCLNTYMNPNIMHDCKKNKFIIKVITDVMDILSTTEIFIIKSHLINKNTWAETTELYSKAYGRNMAKSERTLKRMQSQAIKKMLEVINNLPAGNIFQ